MGQDVDHSTQEALTAIKWTDETARALAYRERRPDRTDLFLHCTTTAPLHQL